MKDVLFKTKVFNKIFIIIITVDTFIKINTMFYTYICIYIIMVFSRK